MAQGFFDSFASSYGAVKGVAEDLQSKSIMKEAMQNGPAGAMPDPKTPDSQSSNSDDNTPNTAGADATPAGYTASPVTAELATPKSLTAIYNDAAQIALKKNNPSLALKFTKQANEYSKEDINNDINKAKLVQAKI
jgi:hypothetical protein